MQKLKPADYPLLLNAELISLIESLSVLRRLVDTSTGPIDETSFYQQVAANLVGQNEIDSCCVYTMTDNGLKYVAGANRSSDDHTLDPHLLRECEKLALQGVRSGSASSRLNEDSRCSLAVSLSYNLEILGSIVLNYCDIDRYQPWHERLFCLCADIVSQSLMTMRLINEFRLYSTEQDRRIARIDTTLRNETLRRESAESALRSEFENPEKGKYLDRYTGLLNQEFFHRQLRSAVARVRDRDEESSLLLLDIDHFEVINEVAGHAAGDRLIQMVARLLRENMLPGSYCARLGTDEFGILLPGRSSEEVVTWAHRLKALMNEKIFDFEGECFALNTSIGVVHLPSNCPDATQLIRRVYWACQSAQAQNFGLRVFNENDRSMQRQHSQTRLLKQLIRTIDDNAIELFCQPIVKTTNLDTKDTDVLSIEILVRMRDESAQLISGSEMLDLAERYGFSSKLDRLVLTRALDFLALNAESVQYLNHLAINLSGQSIGNLDFLDFLFNTVSSSPIDPRMLCFEITETAAILDIQAASRMIATVKKLGCSFALDDFGSGYASYLYLRELDVDFLKIDGEFIRNIATDPVNLALVRTMVDMAKILDKQVVAEFVENKATLRVLQDIGVDFVQGYYIGRPGPLEVYLKSFDESPG